MDPGFTTATELLRALDAREVSSAELLDGLLEAVARNDGEVNAFVTVDADGARARAAAADEARARGEDLGPLGGLPMTIKDCFETEGIRTTVGAPFLADYVPDRDADAVARLRAAGAIVYGKTNLPMFTADGQAYNEVAGTTNNPWDLARAPGGSSGGSAAALAAGMTPLELGSDIAGSIRIPAAFCGVFGLKPSYGLVPLRGHIPGPPGTLATPDMNAAGPLARDVDDLELALDVLAGPVEADAAAWRLELPPARAGSLRDRRLTVWFDDEACPVDREVVAALRRAADALADAGAQIEEAPPPVSMADSIRLHRMLLKGVSCSGLSPEEFAERQELARTAAADDDGVRANHARWLTMSKREWNFANEERAQARARWAEFFAGHDAFLSPTILCPAIPHDHTPDMEARLIEVNGEQRPYWDQVCWIAPAGAAYLPAVSLPAGLTAAGLPVGLQVTGPYLEDRTALELSRRISEVLGGFVPPPAYAVTAANPSQED
ncbi:MAG: amidase [Actinobacteria bacterium]|nr:amidase [Actinomycetota bacterium]